MGHHHCVLSLLLVSLLLLVEIQFTTGQGTVDTNTTFACPDPLSAVLATMDCIEREDASCASAGYNAEQFKKLHNGIDTNTVIDEGGEFWSGAFSLVDLSLVYNHQMNIGPNQCSIRYVEVVNTTSGIELGRNASTDYPFGQTFLQHEHALVTVDDNCKMILWDQYGDNKEQSDVDVATAVMLCELGFLPAEACSPVGVVVDVDEDPPTMTPVADGPTMTPVADGNDDSTESSSYILRLNWRSSPLLVPLIITVTAVVVGTVELLLL